MITSVKVSGWEHVFVVECRFLPFSLNYAGWSYGEMNYREKKKNKETKQDHKNSIFTKAFWEGSVICKAFTKTSIFISCVMGDSAAGCSV